MTVEGKEAVGMPELAADARAWPTDFQQGAVKYA